MSVGGLAEKEDRPAYVQFERRAIEDKRMTLETGSWVGKDVDYVFVTLPGGRDVYASSADTWFKKQESYARRGKINPEHLVHYKKCYEKFKAGEEMPLNGTPIKGWSSLSPGEGKRVISVGILTVEDLAALNDEGLRRLGMGGRDLVNKAKSWLKSVNDHGKIALQNAELVKVNEHLQTTISSLEEKVEQFSRMVQSQQNQAPQVEMAKEKLMDNREDVYADEVIVPLAKQYEQKFGKKPHWKMKESTIRAKLQE